jgi:hypothetical protein
MVATKAKTSKATAKKATAKKTSKKATAKKTSKKATAKKISKKTSKKATAKPVSEMVLVASEPLKRGINRVKELQLQGIECMWEMGRTIFEIYEKKLYMQMHREDGKAAYDNWSKFCSNELQIGAAYSYKLMDVAVNFDKKTMLTVGVTKLSMLLRVPESAREELVTKAAATPRTALAKEVAQLASGNKSETGRDGFKGEAGKGRAANPKKSDKLTIVRKEARVVVALFKRGTTKRAMDLNDAQGVEQCANGVSVHYMLVIDKHGQLQLVVESRRTS